MDAVEAISLKPRAASGTVHNVPSKLLFKKHENPPSSKRYRTRDIEVEIRREIGEVVSPATFATAAHEQHFSARGSRFARRRRPAGHPAASVGDFGGGDGLAADFAEEEAGGGRGRR